MWLLCSHISKLSRKHFSNITSLKITNKTQTLRFYLCLHRNQLVVREINFDFRNKKEKLGRCLIRLQENFHSCDFLFASREKFYSASTLRLERLEASWAEVSYERKMSARYLELKRSSALSILAPCIFLISLSNYLLIKKTFLGLFFRSFRILSWFLQIGWTKKK